jgi:hypothetical protein
MAEKFNMADFFHKNSWFLVAEPLNEMLLFLDMLNCLHCSIVNNLLPVLKNQNGFYIQDGVENVYFFHAIFSKMIFLLIFICFCLLWVKIKLLWKNYFLENSKWQDNLIWKMIFFKKIQDFTIAQQLNEMFSFFDML